MRVAMFADAHLNGAKDTVQELFFNRAMAAVKDIGADILLSLGDVTACGAKAAAIRFAMTCMYAHRYYAGVAGNSDLRNPETADKNEGFLTKPELTFGGVSFIGIDTAPGFIRDGERQRLSALEVQPRAVLFMHHPPMRLDNDSQNFLRGYLASLRERGVEILFIAAGHEHYAAIWEYEGVKLVLVRALDPDKCIGGAPQLMIADIGEGVTFSERVLDEDLPEHWTDAERGECLDQLGIACYRGCEDIRFAIEHSVPHIEVRLPDPEYLPLLKEYRGTLSVHTLGAAFEASCQFAIRAGAKMITVHDNVDRDIMEKALRPVADAGIDILFENDHTTPGVPPKPTCTPEGLKAFKDDMQNRLGINGCGYRLDIGHARNNRPISEEYPIGMWLSMIGPEAHGYHLHQTLMTADAKMHNHHPITGIHDGLIAFDGFLAAWRRGMIAHAPIILEIREGEGAAATWLRLKDMLTAKK